MKFYQKWEACVCNGGNRKEYFKATVPGNVQKDYAEHIGIEDLFFGDSLTELENPKEAPSP